MPLRRAPGLPLEQGFAKKTGGVVRSRPLARRSRRGGGRLVVVMLAPVCLNRPAFRGGSFD
jgi:hypothetical protein